LGIIFIGIDGPYYISGYGIVAPLTNNLQSLVPDIRMPFQQIVNPGRAAAAYSGGIYRVCIDTNLNDALSTNDYWFDITSRRWNGPHTWPFDCASPYKNKFVVCDRVGGAAIYFSEIIPVPTSVYNDNGTAISVEMKTSFLPKMPNVNVKEVIESTVEITAQAGSGGFVMNALNENYNVISNATVQFTSNAGTVKWGGTTWGAAVWNAAANEPSTETVPWTEPLIFKKLAIQMLGTAAYFMSIGAFFAKYKNTGYTNIN
ncbi:MAG: hypothetical protein B7X10_05475, partial [Burkholderiales bacterium 21-58-4]